MATAKKPAAPEAAAAASASEAPAKKVTKGDVVACIVKNPTASDQQVAAEVGTNVDFVQDVRYDMGPRHTWPKPKED
jgi:hypothetical protein